MKHPHLLEYVLGRGPVLATVIAVAKEQGLRVEVSEATGRILIFMAPAPSIASPIASP